MPNEMLIFLNLHKQWKTVPAILASKILLTRIKDYEQQSSYLNLRRYVVLKIQDNKDSKHGASVVIWNMESPRHQNCNCRKL